MEGKRFDKPTVGWACGVTGEVVRDTVQKILVGRTGQEGTGAIPKDAIAELVSARGIPELLDTIRVNHVSGGVSTVGLKSYLSGREKFQGETLDYVWLDEEPPIDIFTEALTRTNVGAGPVWMTFTPLQGVSTVVKRFLHEKSPDRKVITMTISDVSHYSDDEKRRLSHHTRNMRLRRELRAYPFWARAESSRSRKNHLPSTTSTFRHTGPVSAEWTSVGTTRLRLWKWFGTAIVTLFTLAARIG